MPPMRGFLGCFGPFLLRFQKPGLQMFRAGRPEHFNVTLKRISHFANFLLQLRFVSIPERNVFNVFLYIIFCFDQLPQIGKLFAPLVGTLAILVIFSGQRSALFFKQIMIGT